jgi:hypothetical protein
MRIVGSAKGINLHAPDDSYFSYFNSPYIGHKIGSAIDIYPFHQEWNGIVCSPVSGKIVKIRQIRMGQPKQFPTNDFDYGIGILPENSDTEIVRIMHCKPSVSEGERIDLGDPIGNTIRSRFFNYWTGPHYHVEVLSLDAFSRSSKSYPLELGYNFESTQSERRKQVTEFSVELVTKDNIIGYPRNLEHAEIQDLVGLSATNQEGRIVGILDGGLSHYRLGGLIGTSQLKKGKHIKLVDAPVGIVHSSKPGASLFERGPVITSFLDDIELHGLSCFIYPKHYTRKKTPQLILIPKNYGQFKGLFDEGDLCELRITSNINTVKAD